MLKFAIKTSVHSPLNVSVHLDHPQGAYDDPCWSYTFVELSVKYIVHGTALDRHNSLKHMLPQHCKTFNDVFYW
jgi:hypothetical protein